MAELLDEGRGLLLHAYCLGDEECSDMAWPVFVEAFIRAATLAQRSCGSASSMPTWDSSPMRSRCWPSSSRASTIMSARRLLVEARWWRDNGHLIAWLPPLQRRRALPAYDGDNRPTTPDDAENNPQATRAPTARLW